MPKTSRTGKPVQNELPSTIRKSDAKAQRTFAEAHDSALAEYGQESRAHRVAYSALKHSYEKVGDHWEPKAKHGPSDQSDESVSPDAGGNSAEGTDTDTPKNRRQRRK